MGKRALLVLVFMVLLILIRSSWAGQSAYAPLSRSPKPSATTAARGLQTGNDFHLSLSK